MQWRIFNIRVRDEQLRAQCQQLEFKYFRMHPAARGITPCLRRLRLISQVRRLMPAVVTVSFYEIFLTTIRTNDRCLETLFPFGPIFPVGAISIEIIRLVVNHKNSPVDGGAAFQWQYPKCVFKSAWSQRYEALAIYRDTPLFSFVLSFPRPASLLSSLCSSWRAASPALQKELRERRDRSNAGYYKTKDDAWCR